MKDCDPNRTDRSVANACSQKCPGRSGGSGMIVTVHGPVAICVLTGIEVSTSKMKYSLYSGSR
jgi:hypothetical protein